MVVAFDDFELDLASYELRRGGEPVALQRQVFDVLAYLVEHRDRVVTKHELLDAVWGSRFVSESALTSRIKSARQALDDDGRAQRLIKTVHGRGYRFVAHVDTEQALDDGAVLPPVAMAPTDRGNLPAERTPLFGRADDIDLVSVALARHRLVSLLGIGGTGKTRLAVAAARASASRFPDGVWFIDLVPVDDGDGIDLAIADATRLSIDDPAGVHRQIASVIAQRQALFVIDNVEHVADAAGQVLDDLLESTTAVHFLVTSRVPLGLPDERRIVVEPLRTDDDAEGTAPAVELLTSTAERLGASVGDDPAVLHRICRQLDGIPLAIELAAAQLRHLSPAAVVERLDRRFEVLADRVRPGRERHASLHDVLCDTFSEVGAPERTLLAQMSAFPRSFEIDDLGGVASPARPGEIESALGELVDRSLVVHEAGTDSRYRLLETVKLFVRDECAPEELTAIDDRHAAWCLELVGTDPSRYVNDFALADWCFDHYDDLRVATRHLDATERAEDACRLTVASTLTMHADLGPRAADTLGRIDRHLAVVGDDTSIGLLHLTGVMCGMATRSPETIAGHGALAMAAADRSGEPLLRSAALVLGSWSAVFGDPERAVAMTVRAGQIADEAGDRSGRDFADGYRAFHLAMLRRYDEAVALARQVIDRAPGDRPRNYPTHVAVAALASIDHLADPDGVSRWAEEVLDTPSRRNSMWANDLLAASIHAAGGRHERAAAIANRIRDRLRQAGQDPYPDLLLPPAALAYRRGESERAERWLWCVKAAGQPTQSFQATILYRRLREAVGLPADRSEPAPIDEIGEEALAWLADPR